MQPGGRFEPGATACNVARTGSATERGLASREHRGIDAAPRRRRPHDHRRRRRVPRLRRPGQPGAVANYRPRYGHYIGGEFVEPAKGQYFENISPVNGKSFTEVGRGTVEDIDRAVDVAWKAFSAWGKTSPRSAP